MAAKTMFEKIWESHVVRTEPDGTTLLSSISNSYDSAGQLTESIDADGHVTRYGYDAEGRQTSVTEAATSSQPLTTSSTDCGP